jgi:hypothetical protein
MRSLIYFVRHVEDDSSPAIPGGDNVAKGDFIFAGADTTTFTSQQLRAGRHEGESDVAISGLTLTYLFVTVQLSTQGDPQGEVGTASCVCKADITDYLLQVQAYGGTDVLAGPPQKLNIAHELVHVKFKKLHWDARKAELETLLEPYSYECSPDCKVQITQDVFLWFRDTLFGQTETEERAAVDREEEIKDRVRNGEDLDAVLAELYPDGLREHPGAARRISVAPRFRSEVFIKFEGRCWQRE